MLLTTLEAENVIKKTMGWLSKEDIQRIVSELEAASRKQWHEVDAKEDLGAGMSVQCKDICELGAAHHGGRTIKAFVRND